MSTLYSIFLQVLFYCYKLHITTQANTTKSLDPVITQSVLDRQLTTILFASESPVILTGDDNGAINVYKMYKISGHVEGASTGLKAKISDPKWVEQQAQSLQSVLTAKLNGITSSS